MNLIVAANENWVIGKGGTLLYSLPDDLKYFKEKTMNKVVVMGSKTYESLPFRPLKNRTNIVLAFEGNFDGTTTVHDFEELKQELEKYNDDDIFIIGGGSIYNAMLRYCKRAYITKIFRKDDGDTYFPNLDEMPNWHLATQGETLTQNDINFAFCVYENDHAEPLENLVKKNKYDEIESIMWKALGQDTQITLHNGTILTGWVSARKTEWENKDREKQGMSIILTYSNPQNEIELFAEDIKEIKIIKNLYQ